MLMRFLDEVVVHLASGGGGHGSVSFRRESCLPKGGPDGGNGGRGGDVILQANAALNTLIDFRYRSHFKARRGGDGAGKNRSGKHAEPLVVDVPLGCEIVSEDGQLLFADLNQEGKQYRICRGGRGGYGNTHFKSSVKRTPRFAQKGEAGEERTIRLRLKVIADVGIVGCPNAGKSSFLRAVTNADASVGDYPFTTVHVGLGVYENDDRRIVFADIPGLVEDAHQGIGLGSRFLGHIERCSVLLWLLDGDSGDPLTQFRTLREELASYHTPLHDKPFVVAVNKIDVCSSSEVSRWRDALQKESGHRHIFAISCVTGEWDGLLSHVARLHQSQEETSAVTEWHPLDG